MTQLRCSRDKLHSHAERYIHFLRKTPERFEYYVPTYPLAEYLSVLASVTQSRFSHSGNSDWMMYASGRSHSLHHPGLFPLVLKSDWVIEARAVAGVTASITHHSNSGVDAMRPLRQNVPRAQALGTIRVLCAPNVHVRKITEKCT